MSLPALEAPVEVFVDARDHGRALRVTWHPETGLLVVSIWRDDTCVATTQVPAADLARLSHLLTDALASAAPR